MADVLCGDVTPSGKLEDTFAKSYADYPPSANFAQHSGYVNYAEDIFVDTVILKHSIPAIKKQIMNSDTAFPIRPSPFRTWK